MNAEAKALLDQINTYTNEIAAVQTTQAIKTQEISDDLDVLVARVADPELKTRLQQHADTLAAVAAAERAQAETLTNLAAKHEEPLPEPVPPGPVA